MRKFVAIGVVISVAVLWLAAAFSQGIARSFGHELGLEKLGQWGDSFGGLNALFAAAGFSAVVWTLLEQQRQNRLSIRDQHLQRFDGSFFELLRLLRETRNDVRYRHGLEYCEQNKKEQIVRRGMPAFLAAWSEAKYWIEKQDFDLTKSQVGLLYHQYVHKRYESSFGPYFRLLYTIFVRIKDDRVLTPSEKELYANLVRSQLNSYELALVGLNGLAPISKDLADLIEEFHLLKYIPENTSRRRILGSVYSAEAFKSRD